MTKQPFPEDLPPALAEILGMPNFTAGPIAHAFVAAGLWAPPEGRHKAEAEQAFVLHWLVGLYLEHGDDWRPIAGVRIRDVLAIVKDRRDARFKACRSEHCARLGKCAARGACPVVIE